MLPDLVQWATDIAYSFGYVGIAVLVMLGNMHLPIPTEITLPLAGFLVGQGRFAFVPALLWTTGAAIASSVILYLPGRWFGEERLRRFVGRVERVKFVSKFVSTAHLDKADAIFERHGGKAILIGHLIPGVGGFISIPAGVKRMPIWGRFTVYSVIGTIPYNLSHVLLGWALGYEWQQAEQYASKIMYGVAFLAIAGFFWYLLRRYMGNDKNRSSKH